MVHNTPAPVQTDVQAEDSSDTTQDAAVTDQIYTIFVSGIDTRGDITASSRSDVNIVLTVNARTKQVLMISTPRDYYVPLSISNGVPDKLTPTPDMLHSVLIHSVHKPLPQVPSAPD